MAENAIFTYYHSYFSSSNVRIGIGRAGNVIGGGDWAKDRIIPDCIRSWSNKKPVNIRNPGYKTLATCFRTYRRVYFTLQIIE